MKLDCIDVSKRFGSVTALDRLNLHLEDRRIHGLLGRNGAGKTTLLRMMGNLIQPSDGQLLWEGKPLWENPQAQQQIFLSTEKSWFSELNANEIARWMKRSYPNFSSEQFFAWAKRFELNCKTPNLKLSTGYRSVLRALLALSVHTPLLLLDEPTLGMDAFHRELFYKLLIESYTESPSCILLSTHLISEVEGLLERVTISTTESCWSMKRSKRCWSRATVCPVALPRWMTSVQTSGSSAPTLSVDSRLPPSWASGRFHPLRWTSAA